MATWQYNGDQQLQLPTLGVVVSNGDQFDGPDDLALPDFALAKGKAKPAPAVADPAPSVPDQPVAADPAAPAADPVADANQGA